MAQNSCVYFFQNSTQPFLKLFHLFIVLSWYGDKRSKSNVWKVASTDLNANILNFERTFATEFGRSEKYYKRMCLGEYSCSGNALPDAGAKNVWRVPALFERQNWSRRQSAGRFYSGFYTHCKIQARGFFGRMGKTNYGECFTWKI